MFPIAYAMMESRMSTQAKHLAGRRRGGFCRSGDQVIALLRQRGRVAYRTVLSQFLFEADLAYALSL
jgi:hypothetical protein